MADFWRMRDGTMLPLMPRTPQNSPPDPRFGYDPYAAAARQFAAAEATGSLGFSPLSSRVRPPIEMAMAPVGDGVTMPRPPYQRQPMTGADVGYASQPQMPSVPALPPKVDEQPFTGLTWEEGRKRLAELNLAQMGKKPGVDYPLPGGVKLAPADPDKQAAYQQVLADRKADEATRWQAVQGRQREEGYRDAGRTYGPQITPLAAMLSGQMDPNDPSAMMGALSWANPQGALAYGKWDSENNYAAAPRNLNQTLADPTEARAADVAIRQSVLQAIAPLLERAKTDPSALEQAAAMARAMGAPPDMDVRSLVPGTSDPAQKIAQDAAQQKAVESAILAKFNLEPDASPWTLAGRALELSDQNALTDDDLAALSQAMRGRIPPQDWSITRPFTFPTSMTGFVPAWNRDNFLLDYLRTTPNPTVAGMQAYLKGAGKLDRLWPAGVSPGLGM